MADTQFRLDDYNEHELIQIKDGLNLLRQASFFQKVIQVQKEGFFDIWDRSTSEGIVKSLDESKIICRVLHSLDALEVPIKGDEQ